MCLIALPHLNLGVGLGENIDTYLMLERGLRFRTEGYLPSRSWGNPLYEVWAHPLIQFAGPSVARNVSWLWHVGSLGVLWRFFLRRTRNERDAFLGTSVLGCLPVMVIAANTLLETAQALFFFFLAFTTSDRPIRKLSDSVLPFLAAAACAATRVEGFILIVALAITRMGSFPSERRRTLILSLSAIVVAALPYWLLYRHSTVLEFSILNTGDPIWMRLVKSGIGMAAALGTLTLLWSIPRFRPLWNGRHDPAVRLAGVLWILLFLRFVLLPDEVEYFSMGAAAALMVLVLVERSVSARVVLIATLLVSNFVRFSYFARDPVSGAIQWKPGIAAGALLVDRYKRVQNEYIRNHFVSDYTPQLRQAGCVPERFSYMELMVERFPKQDPDRRCVLVSLKWLVRMRDVVMPSQGESLSEFLAVYDKTVILHPLNRDRGWRRFITSGIGLTLWSAPEIKRSIASRGPVQIIGPEHPISK